MIVGSGVSEGEFVNRAQVLDKATDSVASGVASATVRVIPDPNFDCTDVIGKVFDDVNMNGYQDEGEPGLPGVRLVTARGLIVTTDAYGRFHLTCAVVPDPDRGSNFIIKLDDRSLPTGYRVTTENPRVERATRGKMIKFNFGAAIHRVVKLDVADGVFEPGTVEMRIQWKQRMKLLQGELKKATSVLRLSYLAENESESLVKQRLEALKREIATTWKSEGGPYDLSIETEVFWRTGAPR
jgi:large repetitive protein